MGEPITEEVMEEGSSNNEEGVDGSISANLKYNGGVSSINYHQGRVDLRWCRFPNSRDYYTDRITLKIRRTRIQELKKSPYANWETIESSRTIQNLW